MYINDILLSRISPELPDSLKKRQALYIAYGAADFYDNNIYFIGYKPYAFFYLVCDVRNYLNGAAQVVSPALLGDNRVIYLSCGKIAVFSQFGICKPLVVPQIQIGFCAVIGNVNLSVLKRIHCSRININVRIEFLNRYRKTPAFKERSDSCGSESLAQR